MSEEEYEDLFVDIDEPGYEGTDTELTDIVDQDFVFSAQVSA